MVNLVPDEVWALIFLIASAIFLWAGHAKRILLLELVALLMTIFGAAWTITTPMPAIIPLLFILANVVIFALDVSKK
jgi:hypothetical protein